MRRHDRILLGVAAATALAAAVVTLNSSIAASSDTSVVTVDVGNDGSAVAE